MAVESAPSRKGWTSATLERLGVGLDTFGRYVFTITDATGQAVGAVRYSDEGKTPKMKADKGSKRDLWPSPESIGGEEVRVVEGEPDAVSMAEMGYPAVAIPGVGKTDETWPTRIAKGRRRVYLYPDADSVGRGRMAKLATAIAATGVEAVVIDLYPERSDGSDVGDMLVAIGRDAAHDDLIAAESFGAPVAAQAEGTRVMVRVRASDVRIKPVLFLWRPWLPLGKVTILAGAPGQGKSQLTAFLAAQVTRGWFEPTDVAEPGDVVILTAEDDLADTVVPRLMAAGADLARVETIAMRKTMPGGITSDGLIKLPGDVEALHGVLKEGKTRLVIFDPVASFIGRDHSTYVNQDVRDVLDPIVALAAKYGVAVILVLHLNKSEAKTWATKIGESHAFQAVARTILAMAPDPDDEDGEHGIDKVLAITKANLVAGLVPAMKLRVQSTVVFDDHDVGVETSLVKMNGQAMIYADDLLSDASETSARREALAFLVSTLAKGPMESKALKSAAKSAGIGWRTIERCYREVCKSAKPAKARGPWLYELQSRHLDTMAEGEYGGDRDSDSPESGLSAVRQGRELAGSGNGDDSGEVGGHTPADLEAYRRERDRRLGEGWDDE